MFGVDSSISKQPRPTSLPSTHPTLSHTLRVVVVVVDVVVVVVVVTVVVVVVVVVVVIVVTVRRLSMLVGNGPLPGGCCGA